MRVAILRQSPVLVPTVARDRKFARDRKAPRRESRLRMLVWQLTLKLHREFCARCRQRCRAATDFQAWRLRETWRTRRYMQSTRRRNVLLSTDDRRASLLL